MELRYIVIVSVDCVTGFTVLKAAFSLRLSLPARADPYRR